jgi:4-hydroxybenzoate polyprenyltransferase
MNPNRICVYFVFKISFIVAVLFRFSDFLVGYARLIRWPNLLMIVFTQYLVRIFLIGPRNDWSAQLQERFLFLISLSTVLIAAAGYIINDYFDVKIDLVNKPQRVVIGRYLRRRKAMIVHQILNVTGCLIGLCVSKWVFVCCVVAVSLLWCYSAYFKKKPFIGNFLVAFMSAFSLLILLVYYPQNQLFVWLYAIFSFIISLIRELIKDIEDIKGDAIYGGRTLPIIWGIRSTKYLIYVLSFFFIGTIFFILYVIDNQHLTFIFIIILMIFLCLIYQLYRADTQREYVFLSQFSKFIMLLGILSIIFI